MSKSPLPLFEEGSLEDRYVGCLLGGFSGDCLGAPVEGFSASKIIRAFPKGLVDFQSGKHMGLEHLPERLGMYTDDTNSCLALATSLLEHGLLDPAAIARKYAEFWSDKDNPPRGYPGSAMAVMKMILAGADCRDTGTAVFKNGSFANGGAMRIAPVGLCFHPCSADVLYDAARWAVVSSHTHPVAIDAAFIQAAGVQYMLGKKPSEANGEEYLQCMVNACRTKEMKQALSPVLKAYRASDPQIELALGADFQIKADEAMAAVCWIVAYYIKNPLEAVIRGVALGGDTDTIGAMVGNQVGALHGTKWLPDRWLLAMENGNRGRDYVVDIARRLSKMTFDEHSFRLPSEKKSQPQ